MTFKLHALLRELSDGEMLICSFVSLNFVMPACNNRFKKYQAQKRTKKLFVIIINKTLGTS